MTSTTTNPNVNVLRVDPDGTVTAYEGADPLRLAGEAFDGRNEVITCRNPWTRRTTVGVVHDTGRLDGLPLNEKAWALYGGSPIFGPMFYSLDLPYPPLPDEVVAMLLSDEDWIGDDIRAAMQRRIEGELR